jgi:hypothetical protein
MLDQPSSSTIKYPESSQPELNVGLLMKQAQMLRKLKAAQSNMCFKTLDIKSALRLLLQRKKELWYLSPHQEDDYVETVTKRIRNMCWHVATAQVQRNPPSWLEYLFQVGEEAESESKQEESESKKGNSSEAKQAESESREGNSSEAKQAESESKEGSKSESVQAESECTQEQESEPESTQFESESKEELAELAESESMDEFLLRFSFIEREEQGIVFAYFKKALAEKELAENRTATLGCTPNKYVY